MFLLQFLGNAEGREMFTERYVHVALLLFLEMVCQNVAKLCNVWNCVLSQGHPFIAGKSLAFFLSCCCTAAFRIKGGTVWALPSVISEIHLPVTK